MEPAPFELRFVHIMCLHDCFIYFLLLNEVWPIVLAMSQFLEKNVCIINLNVVIAIKP